MIRRVVHSPSSARCRRGLSLSVQYIVASLASLLVITACTDSARPLAPHATGSILTTISSTGCAAVPSGLVAWWPGNGTANDIQGGRHGTVVGTVTFPTGVVGQAFGFNRTGHVSVADDPLWTFGVSPFSIELWVNFTSIAGRDAILGHDDGTGEFNKWIFWYDAVGHTAPFGPALRLHTNDHISTSPRVGPIDPVSAPWSPVVGRWYHVAITRGASTYTLYIDGTAVATNSNANPIQDAAAPLTIGEAEGFTIDGAIDEVSIYNRALTSTEVAGIYNAGAAGKCQQVYSFGGFSAPVDNPPTVNAVSAGAAVAVKFGLGGDFGLNVFAAGYPMSGAVACGTAVVDDIEETVSAGQSGLRYDATSGLYIYTWKTDKAWRNTCRQLVLRFADGQEFRANFRFR